MCDKGHFHVRLQLKKKSIFHYIHFIIPISYLNKQVTSDWCLLIIITRQAVVWFLLTTIFDKEQGVQTDRHTMSLADTVKCRRAVFLIHHLILDVGLEAPAEVFLWFYRLKTHCEFPKSTFWISSDLIAQKISSDLIAQIPDSTHKSIGLAKSEQHLVPHVRPRLKSSSRRFFLNRPTLLFTPQ